MMAVDQRADEFISFDWLEIHHPWGGSLVVLFGSANAQETKSLGDFFPTLDSRLREFGGHLTIITRKHKNVSLENLKRKVIETKNEKLRAQIAEAHVRRMYDEYVDRENSEEAYFHGSLAERYGLRFDGDDSNNFGYVALSLGHLEEAKGLFLDAVRSYEEMPYLPMYNLAMVLAKSGDISGAITHLERAMEKAKDVPKTKRTASCLFAPIVRDGSLDLVEKRGHVDVWEMAKEGIAFLKQHCATKS